jgi:hypothetical protein
LRAPWSGYAHRRADVEAILAAQGFVRRVYRTTLIWQLAVYERPTT